VLCSTVGASNKNFSTHIRVATRCKGRFIEQRKEQSDYANNIHSTF